MKGFRIHLPQGEWLYVKTLSIEFFFDGWVFRSREVINKLVWKVFGKHWKDFKTVLLLYIRCN